MPNDRQTVYLLVPERKGNTWTTRLKRAVVRTGEQGREDLVDIARILQQRI